MKYENMTVKDLNMISIWFLTKTEACASCGFFVVMIFVGFFPIISCNRSVGCDLGMVHHLRTSSPDPNNLAEMSSFFDKTKQFLADTLNRVVVMKITVFWNVPFEKMFCINCRMAKSLVALVTTDYSRNSMTRLNFSSV